MWKGIKNFENYYQISTKGIVRSIDRRVKTAKGYRFYKGRVLEPNIGTNGYYYVILSKPGVSKTAYIHKLVADAYLENPNSLSDVDHINENKLDNRLENLRYLSHCNNAYRSNKGVDRYDKHLEHNPKAKKVIGTKDGKVIETIDCAKKMVDKYGINYSTLRKQLQNDNCIINGVKYYYEINFNKEME